MNRNTVVGLFVLAGIALFTAGLYMIGSRQDLFAKHLVIYTTFDNLSGITQGAKVQVAGMDAGQVEQIEIPSAPGAGFRLRLKINEGLHGLVRTDSLASVATEGVVGDTFLSIAGGSAAVPAVKPGATLRSKEPTELADLLDQAKGTIADVDLTVRNANGLLSSVGGNLNRTLTTARGTIVDVDAVVNGVKRGDGVAGMLLRDPAMASSVRRTLGNAETTTESFEHASAQADGLLGEVRSRNFPAKVDDTLASARSAAANVDAATLGIRQTVAEVTAPDVEGNTGGENLSETLGNVDAATGALAEDAEALKHNFLFRGFFHQRGYFTLSGIPAPAYRKDAAFSNPKNIRLWLGAGELFAPSTNGADTLTAAGRERIDSVLAPWANALQGAPLMVEGYGTDSSGDPRISHTRALLVRKYIEEHYSLELTDTGAVGLGNEPPKGVMHTDLAGVCIVLIAAHR